MLLPGSDNALSFEDREALAAVLPGTELFESEFDFYLHASSLFKAASSTSHETMFSQLSLAVAPPGIDTTSLWHGLIKGLTDLGLYEDAYAALISTPYDRLYVGIFHSVHRFNFVSVANVNVSPSSCIECATRTQSSD